MTIDDNTIPPEPTESPEPAEPLPHSIHPQIQDAPPPGVRAETLYGGDIQHWLPEDLRVPWGWSDIILLVGIAIFGVLLSGFAVVMVLAAFGVSTASLSKSPEQFGFVAVLAQILLDLGLMVYLAGQMHLRFASPFWRTIGWRALATNKVRRWTAYFALICGGFFLATAVSAAEQLFPPKHPLPIETMFQTPRTALLFMLSAVLLAPIVEETIFRGYLYPVVARSAGVGAGVVITGTLFGLLHAPQLWPGIWQIALLVMVGILFTLVRAVTRTVTASYILHASYNGLPVVAALLPSLRIHSSH